MSNSVAYGELKQQRLKDPEYAEGYLEAALGMYYEDRDNKAFLSALRDIAIAQQGMSTLAKNIGKNRQSLYKALSPAGNPTFETLSEVLSSLGYKFDIVKIAS